MSPFKGTGTAYISWEEDGGWGGSWESGLGGRRGCTFEDVLVSVAPILCCHSFCHGWQESRAEHA